MIGVFDSGHGGLTVLAALVERFDDRDFIYLGDHANVPYGDRDSEEIVDLTRRGVEALFERGCRLVLLGCNTATAVAARRLQQSWLPESEWKGNNVLGIVAPTVEAATQTAWGVTTPQYPQKYNTDVIVVFGTTRTIETGVYAEEIRKRCPQAKVVQQSIPRLAGAIEGSEAPEALDELVAGAVDAARGMLGGEQPDRVILGCTHYPVVEPMFRRHLPDATRILSQPRAVADSLEDYLHRHTEYDAPGGGSTAVLTTGDPAELAAVAAVFWPEIGDLEQAPTL